MALDDPKNQEEDTVEEEVDMDTAFIPRLRNQAITSSPQKAGLIVLSGGSTGQMILLDTKKEWILGRSPDTDVVFLEESISRKHCKISVKNSKEWEVEDLGSSNGCFVNGNKIQKVHLKSGDKIQLGNSIVLKFVMQDELEAAFQRELYESAIRDGLTRAFTKRYFLDQAEIEFNFHKRTKKPLSIILVDIDFFKKLNDTYGHLAGDTVLKELGNLFLGVVRKGDLVGRFGGEEFSFLLRESTAAGADIFAERIRKMIEHHPFMFDDKRINITLSLGVATYSQNNFQSLTEALQAADDFLYQAKKTGRNRLCSIATAVKGSQ